jgi:hypothetical protein
LDVWKYILGYGTITGRGALIGDMSSQSYRRHKKFFIIDRLNNHSAKILERANTTSSKINYFQWWKTFQNVRYSLSCSSIF